MDRDIKSLKGIGEARAKVFNKINVYTIWDLLNYFPRSYEDRTIIKDIDECEIGEYVCVNVKTQSAVHETRIKKNMTIYTLKVYDSSSALTIKWYNNRFVKSQILQNESYIFYGKITRESKGLEMINPMFEKLSKQKYMGKIVPIYPLTAGITQKNIQNALSSVLSNMKKVDDPLPPEFRKKYNLSEINYSYKNIHFPKSFDDFKCARRRFVFDELFTLQLALLLKKDKIKQANGIIFKNIGCVTDFISSLPYQLTNAQSTVINDILSDFQSGIRSNRLIQGDVGSGKTVVAAVAMYCCVKAGYQAIMMAPTEILAKQHYETLTQMFKNKNINIVFLSGGLKLGEKKAATKMIESGEADVIVGTNAVIQQNIIYNKVGLVIADEQHRFGVDQRTKLVLKGINPHMLIMSATPIPRTLALILYGDLNSSIIDELPPGRKPVKTYAVGEEMRNRVYKFIKKNVDDGGQCYIVCPLIEESKQTDLKNAVDLTKKLIDTFPQYQIGLMHGKLKQAEKDDIMNKFLKNELQILVSTTVIEVGVNVPNSNLMVIENAERFGLSQLHQLRGRVGRGVRESYCILFAHGNNEITKKRMETMCKSNDGFYISEQDLKLRGPGDFFGTRQHGLPEMKIANLFEDADILSIAQKATVEILKYDKELTSLPKLKDKIKRLYDAAELLN